MLCVTILRDRTTVQLYNCTCKPGYYGDGNVCHLGNIFPAVFLPAVFFLNVSICLDNSNETFVYNNYVYRDIDVK